MKALLVGRFFNALGSMAWVFVPLYLVSDRGLDTPEAGSIAAVYGVGIIVGNLVGGSVGDRFGMRGTLAVASLAAAVGCALVPFTPTGALPVRARADGRAGRHRPPGVVRADHRPRCRPTSGARPAR